MSNKSCVAAIVTFEPKARDEGRAILKDISVKARQDAGCLRFVVYEDKERPGHFAINEEWETDHHLQDHLSSAHVKSAFDAIGKAGGVIVNVWCEEI